MPERRITREKKYRFIRLFFEKGLVLKGSSSFPYTIRKDRGLNY